MVLGMSNSSNNQINARGLITLLAFGGAVAAAAVWSIWGGDMFPAEPDPTGKPEDWTREDMRRWLSAVSRLLLPSSH